MLISETILRLSIARLIIESDNVDSKKAVEYVKKYLGPEYLYLLAQPALIQVLGSTFQPITVPSHVRDVRIEDHEKDAKESEKLSKGSLKIGKAGEFDIYDVNIDSIEDITDELKFRDETSFLDKKKK